MVKDAKTNEIGFVIPYKIAIDYRNLIVNLIPSYEEKINLQGEQVAKQNQIINNQEKEIDLMKRNATDERNKFTQLQSLCKKYEKELRCKKFWKTASMILAGTTAVLFVTTVAK